MKNGYSIYGLNVNSAIPLPGTASETFLDVDLSFSQQPLSLAHVTAHNTQWQTDGTKLLSTIPSLGQALIESPQNITIYANPDLCSEHLLTLVLGSGLAASLYFNQYIPLHGAAISTEKGALLFLGASGRGKSTLTLTAASLGYKVLSDDVISLYRGNEHDRLMVYPSHNRLKAKGDIAEKLGFVPDKRFTTAPGVNKHPCYLPENCIAQQAEPVIAIYLLQPLNDSATHSLNPLSSVTGMQALSRHCYRPSLSLLTRKHQQILKQNLQLAKQVKFSQLLLPNMENCGGVTGYRQWLNDFIMSQIDDCYF